MKLVLEKMRAVRKNVTRSQNACSVCFHLGHKKPTCAVLKGKKWNVSMTMFPQSRLSAF